MANRVPDGNQKEEAGQPRAHLNVCACLDLLTPFPLTPALSTNLPIARRRRPQPSPPSAFAEQELRRDKEEEEREMRSRCLARAISRPLLKEFPLAVVRGFKVRKFISGKSLLEGTGVGPGVGEIGKKSARGQVQSKTWRKWSRSRNAVSFGLRLSSGAFVSSTLHQVLEQ